MTFGIMAEYYFVIAAFIALFSSVANSRVQLGDVVLSAKAGDECDMRKDVLLVEDAASDHAYLQCRPAGRGIVGFWQWMPCAKGEKFYFSEQRCMTNQPNGQSGRAAPSSYNSKTGTGKATTDFRTTTSHVTNSAEFDSAASSQTPFIASIPMETTAAPPTTTTVPTTEPLPVGAFVNQSCANGDECLGGSICDPTWMLCKCPPGTSVAKSGGMVCEPDATVATFDQSPQIRTVAPGGSCRTAGDQCVGGSFCSSDNGVCTCPEGFSDKAGTCTMVKIEAVLPGEKCNAFAYCTGGAVCVRGLCTCEAPLVQTGNQCAMHTSPVPAKKYSGPGEPCDQGQACAGGSLCSTVTLVCACPVGTRDNGEKCAEVAAVPVNVASVGQACNANSDCVVGAFCSASTNVPTCQCLSTHVEVGKSCYRIVFPGQRGCDLSEQCTAGFEDASCINGVCMCPPGMSARGQTCHPDAQRSQPISVAPGQSCSPSSSSTFACSGGSACIRGFCSCPRGKTLSGDACVKKDGRNHPNSNGLPASSFHSTTAPPTSRKSSVRPGTGVILSAPGSSCAGGQQCIGGSVCRNGFCVCPDSSMVVHNGTCAFGSVRPLTNPAVTTTAPPTESVKSTEQVTITKEPTAPPTQVTTTTKPARTKPRPVVPEPFVPVHALPSPPQGAWPRPPIQPYQVMGSNEPAGYFLQPGFVSPVVPAPLPGQAPFGNAQFMMPGAPGLYLPNGPSQGFPPVFIPEPTNPPLFPIDQLPPAYPKDAGNMESVGYQSFPLLPGLLPAGIRQGGGSSPINAKPKTKTYADKPPRSPVAAPLAASAKANAQLAPPGSSCAPDDHVQCSGGSVCHKGECVCSEGYEIIGELCVHQQAPLESCTHGEQCSGGSLCDGQICQCPGGTEARDGYCQAIPPNLSNPNGPCSKGERCLGDSACNLATGICECPASTIGVGSQCVPLGHLVHAASGSQSQEDPEDISSTEKMDAQQPVLQGVPQPNMQAQYPQVPQMSYPQHSLGPALTLHHQQQQLNVQPQRPMVQQPHQGQFIRTQQALQPGINPKGQAHSETQGRKQSQSDEDMESQVQPDPKLSLQHQPSPRPRPQPQPRPPPVVQSQTQLQSAPQPKAAELKSQQPIPRTVPAGKKGWATDGATGNTMNKVQQSGTPQPFKMVQFNGLSGPEGRCDGGQICAGGSVCESGICKCPDHTLPNGNGICQQVEQSHAAVGEFCVEGTVCSGHSTCLNGRCRCPPGTMQTGPTCIPLTGSQLSLGAACTHNDICIQRAVCKKGICSCQDGYKANNGTCLSASSRFLPRPGDFCTESQLCYGNSHCYNGRCFCLPGSYVKNDTCVSAAAQGEFSAPGDPCIGTENCTGGSYCRLGFCVCPLGTESVNFQCITIMPSNLIGRTDQIFTPNFVNLPPSQLPMDPFPQFATPPPFNPGQIFIPTPIAPNQFPNIDLRPPANAIDQPESNPLLKSGLPPDTRIPLSTLIPGLPPNNYSIPLSSMVHQGGNRFTLPLAGVLASDSSGIAEADLRAIMDYLRNFQHGQPIQVALNPNNLILPNGQSGAEQVGQLPIAGQMTSGHMTPGQPPFGQLHIGQLASNMVGQTANGHGYTTGGQLTPVMLGQVINGQLTPNMIGQATGGQLTPNFGSQMISSQPLSNQMTTGQLPPNMMPIIVGRNDVQHHQKLVSQPSPAPGQHCEKGQVCSGSAICSMGVCACPAGLKIGPESHCVPDGQFVQPGSVCTNGQTCVGGSYCITGICLCPPGQDIVGKECRLIAFKYGGPRMRRQSRGRLTSITTANTAVPHPMRSSTMQPIRTAKPNDPCQKGVRCSGGTVCSHDGHCRCLPPFRLHNDTCKLPQHHSRPLNRTRLPPKPRRSNACPLPENRTACQLPNCFCSPSGREAPNGLKLADTPQFVILTFDDAVNQKTISAYKHLFEDEKYSNKDGCPLRATFFVSHEGTDYSEVQQLYLDGHEIASNSISHEDLGAQNIERWISEIDGQRRIMSHLGLIDPSDIIGFRAPQLSLATDSAYEMMQQSKFLYDNSMSANPGVDQAPYWPQTLDYSIPWECQNSECPSHTYPGLWTIPLNQFFNGPTLSDPPVKTTNPESYTRGSMLRATITDQESDESFYGLLNQNFLRAYRTNKAPYILTLDGDLPYSISKNGTIRGLERFLDEVAQLPDVWYVTLNQLLDWMRSPVPIDQLIDFAPFSCQQQHDRRLSKTPPVCETPNRCFYRTTRLSKKRHSLKTCAQCPSHYPWFDKVSAG